MSESNGSSPSESRAARVLAQLGTGQKAPTEIADHQAEGSGNKAVAGIFDLLALLFGLPFGEDLYRDVPLSTLSVSHWVYLTIGVCCAGFGHMWPMTKSKVPRLLRHIISGLAQSSIAWIAIVLGIFFYGVAPEMWQRATMPRSHSPSAIEIADAVAQKLPPAPIQSSVSADQIAEAVVRKLPSLKDETTQLVMRQSQLADARNAAQNASQDAATARAQLGELQRQQQTAQSNQFIFPPFPIKKRKLTHSEAVDLIDKLSAFSDAFRSLDQPMSQPLILAPFTSRFAQAPPPELDQKKEMASNISTKLKEFRAILQQDVSGIPSFNGEIEDMLGGPNWSMSSSFDELTQSIENYIQVINQITARPTRPDNELIGYILRDPQAALMRPAQKFNSWRSQIPSRIQELQNEARGDL